MHIFSFGDNFQKEFLRWGFGGAKIGTPNFSMNKLMICRWYITPYKILARRLICRNKCKISVNTLDSTMVQWPEWVVCTPRCPNPIRIWPIDFVVPNLKSASPTPLETILKSSKSVHYRQRYAHFLYLGYPFEKDPPGGGAGVIKFEPQHFPILWSQLDLKTLKNQFQHENPTGIHVAPHYTCNCFMNIRIDSIMHVFSH